MEPLASAAKQQLVIKMIDGLSEYEPVWHAMQQYTDTRNEQSEDQLWVLQHRPVFTQGQAGKAEHVLDPGDIPVVSVDRGGQVTYHGPGQLIIYLMLDIDRLGIGSRQLVSMIEQALIQTLKSYNIEAVTRQDAPGVYVDDQKIASLGLRIRKGRSFHGLSFNIDMDLEPFERINPCGYAGMQMTQLENFPNTEALEQVAGRLVSIIKDTFGYADMLIDYSDSFDNSGLSSEHLS